MRKLEIGPARGSRKTPDGSPSATWDTMDIEGRVTHTCEWGRGPLKIASGTYDWVYASHVLEHIAWWRTLDALREVYRILRPGGRLTLWVPAGVEIIQQFVRDSDWLVLQNKSWTYFHEFTGLRSAWAYMNAHVFWGASPYGVGKLGNFHKSMYDAESLAELLDEVGFCQIKRASRNDGEHTRREMEIGVEAYRPA